MKLESLSRKVGGALWLVIALFCAVQQHRINLSESNALAADSQLIKIQQENASLRMRLDWMGQ